MKLIVLCVVTLLHTTHSYVVVNKYNSTCTLRKELREEVRSYQPVVEKILNAALHGSFKSKTYNELGRFVDKFGARFSGTKVLENSIDYVLELSKNHSLDNVHGDSAKVPHWVRGKESAMLLSPRKKKLAMLGLGYSVGTPKQGIAAEAIVVKSFDELKQRAAEVRGKIVVFNEDYTTYGETVQYRAHGATEASKLGAVAVLIRSVTPYSLYTPHTGMMTYGANVTKIPAACITVEDAEFLHRLAMEGELIKINIKMQCKQLPDVDSRNVIAEIRGSRKPEKTVVVSGHIDSWDVGEGAMDDGGGAFIAWGSLALLKSLNLQAKRTIRMIMWTSEEMGLVGSRQYIKKHQNEEPNLQLVMESDTGTFRPVGLAITATEDVKCILQTILEMLKPLGDLKVRSPAEGPDIDAWVQSNIPGASLWTKNEKYFWYHHTNADTLLVEDPTILDMNTALFAATSYIAADLSLDFPRNK